MTSIEITNIVGLTYPYDVYVCNVYGLSCVLVATINTPVPASVTITLPPQFLMAPAVGIKLIASDGCEKFGIFYCSDDNKDFMDLEDFYFMDGELYYFQS